jgi:hypothetical protein
MEAQTLKQPAELPNRSTAIQDVSDDGERRAALSQASNVSHRSAHAGDHGVLRLWKTRTAALRVVSRRRREGTSCGRRSRPALGSSGSIGAMSCAPAGREGTPGAVVPGDAEHSRGAAAGGRATRLQERQQKSCDTRAPARVTGAFTLSSDMGFGQHRLGLRPLRAVGCGNSAWAAVNRSLAAVNADLRPF